MRPPASGALSSAYATNQVSERTAKHNPSQQSWRVQGRSSGGEGGRQREQAPQHCAQAKLKLSGKLANRMDREANSLRAEIFRLDRTNKESAVLLSAIANQHSCSPGEAAAGLAPQAAEEEWW
jgi:hypothetical protein